jgi:hypothetical protein
MVATQPKKFTFPTAFTILFILLVLIALATWLIPAGSYDYNADGEPLPGTYHQVASNPQKLLASALKGPINGMYGIEDASGNSVPLVNLEAKGLANYAAVCGWTLARAHAKGGDAALISGYLGKSDAFDQALARFAAAYADQTERDHAALVRAVRSGRVQAIVEK